MSLCSLVTQAIYDLLHNFTVEELSSLPKELREIIFSYPERVRRFVRGDLEFFQYLGQRITEEEKESVYKAIIRMDRADYLDWFITIYGFTNEDFHEAFKEALYEAKYSCVRYLFWRFVTYNEFSMNLYYLQGLIIASLTADQKEITDELYKRYLIEAEDQIDKEFIDIALCAAIISRNFEYIDLFLSQDADFRRGITETSPKERSNYDLETENKLLSKLKPRSIDETLHVASQSLVLVMIHSGIPFDVNNVVSFFLQTSNCDILDFIINTSQEEIEELNIYYAVCKNDVEYFRNYDIDEDVYLNVLDLAIELDRVEIVKLISKRIQTFTQIPFANKIKSPTMLRVIVENSLDELKSELFKQYIDNLDYLVILMEYMSAFLAISSLIDNYFYDNGIILPTSSWRFIYRYVVKWYNEKGEITPELLNVVVGDVYFYMYLLKKLAQHYKIEDLKIEFNDGDIIRRRTKICDEEIYILHLKVELKIQGWDFNDLFTYKTYFENMYEDVYEDVDEEEYEEEEYEEEEYEEEEYEED